MIFEIEVVDILVDIYTLHINSIWEIYIWWMPMYFQKIKKKSGKK